jgi:hypothetical protein
MTRANIEVKKISIVVLLIDIDEITCIKKLSSTFKFAKHVRNEKDEEKKNSYILSEW